MNPCAWALEGKHISEPLSTINAKVARFKCRNMIATLLDRADETVAVTS
jgi:hypothetical protein